MIRMYLLQYLFQLSCFLLQAPRSRNLSEFTHRHSSVETGCSPSHHLDSGSMQCSRIKQGIVSTPTVCWPLPRALAGSLLSMDVCGLVCFSSLTSALLLQPCSLLRLPPRRAACLERQGSWTDAGFRGACIHCHCCRQAGMSVTFTGKCNFAGNTHSCTICPSSRCGQLKENIRCCLHSAIVGWSFLASKADLNCKIKFFCSFAFKDFIPFFLSNTSPLRICVYVK